jgi:hypothetical protein
VQDVAEALCFLDLVLFEAAAWKSGWPRLVVTVTSGGTCHRCGKR